jgi:hypothetical protein
MLEQIASQAFTLLAGRTLSLKSGSPLETLENFYSRYKRLWDGFADALFYGSAGLAECASVRPGYFHIRYNN